MYSGLNSEGRPFGFFPSEALFFAISTSSITQLSPAENRSIKMAFNADYLNRTLARRSEDSVEAYAKAVERMMALHASKGMLGSGATLSEATRLAIEHLDTAFNSAATFAYSYTNSHGPEIVEPMNSFARGFVTDTLDYLKLRGRNTGLDELTLNRQLGVTEESLRRKTEQLIDDFTHGMMENNKMKKDPLVSLVANQTNSPGAVQQLGVGNFSQSALVQNYQSLVETIDRVMESEEFGGLSEERKALFRDYSGALKDEASSPKADAGRLQRWGTRLVDFCKEAGMKMSTDAIVDILSKIFIG